MGTSRQAFRRIVTHLDVEASYATFDAYEGFTQRYRDVQIWKTVDDMNRYRDAIVRTVPEVVVETGTRWGGFAAWLADSFGVEVITVDIERTEGRPDEWPGVTYVQGSSIDPETVEQVTALIAGRRCMVSLDSDHHSPYVVEEIRAYGELVSPGCYLVVEDGLADLVDIARGRRFTGGRRWVGGPLRAIAQTLATDPRFRCDREIEDVTPISHHPSGWWIRQD